MVLDKRSLRSYPSTWVTATHSLAFYKYTELTLHMYLKQCVWLMVVDYLNQPS